MTEAASRPVVWSIAGSDSGAGAGLQADLRALDTFDVHACTAVAAITAQNSVRVERVEPVATDLLDAQLAALAADLPPAAIKTGLLGSAENVRCVAAWVDRLRLDRPERPVALVVDPVWRASTGADLSGAALREALLNELLPRATAITPNRAEAAWLLGWDATPMTDATVVKQAAVALRALGPQAVVITGGDAGSARSLDCIATPEAEGWLSLPRVATRHHHGSGCVFASSMAAALALDFCTADAAVIAKMSTTHALRHAVAGGEGAGPVRPWRGFGLEPDLLPDLFPAPPTHAATNAGPALGIGTGTGLGIGTGIGTDVGIGIDAGRAPGSGSPGTGFPALIERHMGLYAVVDSAAWVERVLKAGVRTVQLRIKEDRIKRPIEKSAHADLSREVAHSVQAARAANAQLFINDHWQLAIEHGAYGVHLGQEDLGEADLGAIRAQGLRLGISTHSYWEVCRAHAHRPSYIACGPIHATTTKAMPWRPQGAGNLAYWCRVLREPVVAIAGMDVARSHEAARCGAAGVAVLRGIVQAVDLPGTIDPLQRAIAEGRLAPRFPAPDLPRSTWVPPPRV